MEENTSYPEINTSDRRHLLDDRQHGRRYCSRSCCTHKRLCWFFIILAVIIAAHALAVYLIYFRCTDNNNCKALRVMSLNTWGMPAKLGSEFKTERMDAIGKEISKGEFDVYLLEELWMEPDHDTIANAIPANYAITGFRQLSTSSCDGRVLPTYCSGLAIVSRHPFKQVEFNSFTDHGDAAKMFVDGEWFARKGVGRVQIEPLPNITVDVFVTHTCADPDASHGYNNSYYRKKQVRELMDKYISKSKADVVVLGGDFNAGPVEHEGSPFEMVRIEMQNSVEELFYKLKRWLTPEYTTYGNPSNTFSGHKYAPIMYDYIFRRTNNPKKVTAWTSWFELPLFKTKISKSLLSDWLAKNIEVIEKEPYKPFESVLNAEQQGSNGDETVKEPPLEKDAEILNRSKRSSNPEEETALISFSDHEAVTSTIYLWG